MTSALTSALPIYHQFKLIIDEYAIVNVEKIWSEYQSSLKGFLHNNVSDPDDIDDLLQDILIKSYQNLSKVHDSKKVKSWLFQIAKNTIIDFYRKKNKQPDITDKELWYHDSEPEVNQQLSMCIVPFINELAKEDAELLTAIEIEGLSQKQYAQKLGVNYSTLKSRVQKSRTKLYDLYNECCTFSIDKQGNIIDYQSKKDRCSGC